MLDVGCGEGVLSAQWADRLDPGRVVGVDLEDPKLEGEWAQRGRGNLEFRAMAAEQLLFADDEFDLVTATEVLEHVTRTPSSCSPRCGPRRTRAPARVLGAAGAAVARALNVARGAYVRELGNTPGHLNHWSRGAFEALLGRFGMVVATRSPFPWTMLLVQVG